MEGGPRKWFPFPVSASDEEPPGHQFVTIAFYMPVVTRLPRVKKQRLWTDILRYKLLRYCDDEP
jgi:hypothetical protein